MLIISLNVKLSEKDVKELKDKGINVIANVSTAYGIDDIGRAMEQVENSMESQIKRCSNCAEKREALQRKIEELNKLDREILELTKELDDCVYCN